VGPKAFEDPDLKDTKKQLRGTRGWKKKTRAKRALWFTILSLKLGGGGVEDAENRTDGGFALTRRRQALMMEDKHGDLGPTTRELNGKTEQANSQEKRGQKEELKGEGMGKIRAKRPFQISKKKREEKNNKGRKKGPA